MGLMAVLSVVIVVYLVYRFHRFSFMRRLGERRRLLSWLLAMLPVAALGMFALINATTLAVVLMHLLLGFVICDLAALIIGKIRRRRVGYDIKSAAALLLTVIYLGAGWYAAHHVFVTAYTFETAKALGSLRIVEIADSHLGITQFGDTFAREMERVQAYDPDVVMIVGDFVDDDSDVNDMIEACAALGKLKTTYGVYFVYGNHDDGYFRYRNFSSAQLREELNKNGVAILEDEAVLIDGRFYIVGRRDRSMRGRMDMERLTEGLDAGIYTILLDHQPNDYANEAGRADLVLSGHTHGGPIFPLGQIGLLTHANDRRYGTENREGTDFVVTSGISGWAVPFKTGTYSEFVVIDVKGQ